MKVNILGIKIDDINVNDALGQIEQWIDKPGKHYIVTPNPEIIVAAQKDNRLKEILNDADLAIPDGAGLRLSGKVKNQVAGVDLMERLVKLAAEKGFTASFLGGRSQAAVKTAECLLKKYPKLKVGFAGSGGEVDDKGEYTSNCHSLEPRFNRGEKGNLYNNYLYRSPIPFDRLRAGRSGMTEESSRLRSNNNSMIPPCDLLFVAFGHGKQEKWIANNLQEIPAHVIMTVGGAFDYFSGNISRAPKRMRDLGLEWLYRLIKQPWRIKRQLALIKYVWLIAKERLMAL